MIHLIEMVSIWFTIYAIKKYFLGCQRKTSLGLIERHPERLACIQITNLLLLFASGDMHYKLRNGK